MSSKQTPENFWLKVNKQPAPGCWEWLGSCNNTGYGTVAWDGRVYTAHRIAAWLVGLVQSPSAPRVKQDKSHVLHICDNRKCCNPDHFFLGNYSDNQRDAYSKARRAQARGARHVNAKLADIQIQAIRDAYASGMKQIDIAAQYGVSQTCISRITRGDTYKCK